MTITGIITAIVFGLIIGALARLVLPGKQNIPIWLTILVGIVGAFIGTFLARLFGARTTPVENDALIAAATSFRP